MLRLVSPLSLVLLAVPAPASSISEGCAALAPIVAQAPTTAPDRLATLLPKNAVAVLRARSAQTLIDDANLLTGAKPEERFTVESLFEPLGVPEITSKVALDRPIGVAITLDEGMQPQVWAAVPALDAAGLAAAIPPESGMTAYVDGDYVVVGAGTARPETGTGLGSGAGASDDIALEIDLATVFETFAPMIEMGMAQIEAEVDAADEGDVPPELLEQQVSKIRDFLESARTLNMGLRANGTKIVLGGALTISEGSPMTDWVPEASFDLSRAASLVDPAAMMSFVSYSVPTHDGLGQLEMIESVAANAPPQLAGLIDLELRMIRELGPKMTGLSAVSADLGADGLRACAYVESKEPAELVAALARFLTAPELAELGVVVEPAAPREIGGKNWAEFRLRVDVAALMETFGEGETVPPEAAAEAERALASVLGPDGLRIGMTEHAGMVVYRLGGDDAAAARAIQRIGSQPSNLPAGLANAFASARSVHAGWLGHMDFGRMMSQVSELAASMGEPMDFPVELLGQSFPLSAHLVADGLTWRGALELDAADLARVQKVFAEVQAREAEAQAQEAQKRAEEARRQAEDAKKDH